MNEPILITLKNGGKLKAIEDALCDKNGYNVRSVSYTHLTLPTILLV